MKMTNDIEKTIIETLKPRLKKFGIKTSEVDKNESLISQGIIDSLGFIGFIGQLEQKYDILFEFDDLDTTDFTSINQLIEMIAKLK